MENPETGNVLDIVQDRRGCGMHLRLGFVSSSSLVNTTTCDRHLSRISRCLRVICIL